MDTSLVRSINLHPVPAPPVLFIGRDHELAHALCQLQQRGVVAITGMAGSGKTALAAAVVDASDQPVLWIDIRTDLIASVDPLLWRLAQPLVTAESGIWELLNQMQQLGWNYPAVVRLQMILAALARQERDLLICIDTIEAASDPDLAALLGGLCHYIANTTQTRIKLIAIGRTLPYELNLYALPPLQGLSPEIIHQWAQQCGIALDPDTVQLVYHRTAGHTLTLEHLLQPSQCELQFTDLIGPLRSRPFIKSILSGLTDDEHTFLAYLATRADQHDPIPIERVMQLLRLEELHLVVTTPLHDIVVHPVIRLFFSSFAHGG